MYNQGFNCVFYVVVVFFYQFGDFKVGYGWFVSD